VHASSPAVMTPQGQQVRHTLLQRLHALVHGGASTNAVNVDLFQWEKGRKLLTDLLPLWPPLVVSSTLLSFLLQLPQVVATQRLPLAPVPALSSCLAAIPKELPPPEVGKLLDAAASHGQPTLRSSLERSDVAALLLGLLCCPGLAEALPASLQAFYSALLPIGATSESVWALLNALLPAVGSAAHASMLVAATAALPPDGMAASCREARAAFQLKLQQQVSGALA